MRLSQSRLFRNVVEGQLHKALAMQLPDANIRSSSYLIAEMQARCPQCSCPCRVLALALPPNHETLVEGEWQKVEANAFIFHVARLPDAVSRHLRERSPGFHQVGGDDAAESNWANHCPHCAAVFRDDELHCEPGGFMPSSTLEAQGISLTKVAQAFSAIAAGYALNPEFLASMRRR
jgi:hypothetical protein